MSVKLRPLPNGGLEYDINLVLPSGERVRERRQVPTDLSKSVAERWVKDRMNHLIRHGKPEAKPKEPTREVPTAREFKTRFIEGYARANRHKASGIEAKETILRLHILPKLGDKPLDQITNEDIQQLKTSLAKKAPKTVNGVLTVLSTMLKVAVKWGLIEKMPVTIEQLKVPTSTMSFHDFPEYGRLVEAARRVDPRIDAAIRLAGDAGLRCGEVIGLEWPDVDFTRGQITVRRSEWKGHVTTPKNGRHRVIPMTAALAEALQRVRHLRGPRVLVQDDAKGISQKILRGWVSSAERVAGLQVTGRIHVFRHSFASRLAMRGAPARAIMELCGHADLGTTMRYMHLSPAARDSAIRLLEEPEGTGAGMEAASSEGGTKS